LNGRPEGTLSGSCAKKKEGNTTRAVGSKVFQKSIRHEGTRSGSTLTWKMEKTLLQVDGDERFRAQKKREDPERSHWRILLEGRRSKVPDHIARAESHI